MKMTPDHFRRLKDAIEPLDTKERRKKYLTGDFPRSHSTKNLALRYRWDLFWESRHPNVYIWPVGTYIDAHVDTALRRIIPELTKQPPVYPLETPPTYGDLKGNGDVWVLNHDDTMPENVATLAAAVVGTEIRGVKIEGDKFTIFLNNGKEVRLTDVINYGNFTELCDYTLHTELDGHVITGVGTTEKFTNWHLYSDFGDVLSLDVAWEAEDSGYEYGFDITVENPTSDEVIDGHA